MNTPNHKPLVIAFIVLLAAVVVITLVGLFTTRKPPITLQGQVEATEIRISGKLLGRVDSLLVREGDEVRRGDTLVVINSPLVEAQYRKSEALHRVTMDENRKADGGTRRQVVAAAYQVWQAARSQAALAQKTYERISALYADSVVSRQRFDEAEAAMLTTRATEQSAHEQYLLAAEGLQLEMVFCPRGKALSLFE